MSYARLTEENPCGARSGRLLPIAGSLGLHAERLLCNGDVAFALSLSIALERLKDPCYYRSVRAVRLDLLGIVAKAEDFNGQADGIVANARAVEAAALEEIGNVDGRETREAQPEMREVRREAREAQEAWEVLGTRVSTEGPEEVPEV